ncbi:MULTISPECIES: ABC1 kinase family protein [unclassified Ketobacter]|jgi:aarF domain-containing kinase|uniref:ABC1 kinase family protein n=1 Tax=unclassified Ketobacter TaxID=2639109 RepID=UPI0025C0B31A|nr:MULTISPECIES: AarF/UbiB family protein [unclassified Ketobacter]MEC8811170.1 AarF/UbiB family protein [Pseudomonadota bacterium]|tara:strand:- start:23952 stop:25277 length:1326 start_codon:yes stop_codon:yes gene_type:complete
MATDRPGINRLSATIKGAFRIGQTVRILAQTGMEWIMGDRPPAPKLLRQTFERLGTTYIKLGQFIASSPSVFPDDYVEEFQLCLDKTTPVPFYIMKRVLEKELGKSLETVFAEFDPVPLASASIAQVYAAKLVTGEDVVVKVQKPGVENILLTDLNFLYVGARVLEYFVPNLAMASLSDIVDEIQKGMLAECDFYQEASNIGDFHQFLEETGNTQATAPRVYEQASTMRVLTMERFYGVPFTDLESIQHIVPDPESSLITAMNTWFSSLLFCESFHADVHAGNLLVLKDGRIGFIDFGIVGRIKPSTWESVSKFIWAIGQENYREMAESMLGIGMTDTEVNTERLAQDIEALYSSMDRVLPDMDLHAGDMASISEHEVNKVMMDLVGIGKRHGIHFPREFALLLKQLLYFDRYVRLLAMESNIYMDERLNITPDMDWNMIH